VAYPKKYQIVHSIPDGIEYHLEIGRVLESPKTKSKLENDLYLLSRGEFVGKWEWAHSVTGKLEFKVI
jgi:hypothetical protein